MLRPWLVVSVADLVPSCILLSLSIAIYFAATAMAAAGEPSQGLKAEIPLRGLHCTLNHYSVP
jgi:hypothetical protein